MFVVALAVFTIKRQRTCTVARSGTRGERSWFTAEGQRRECIRIHLFACTLSSVNGVATRALPGDVLGHGCWTGDVDWRLFVS